MLPRLRTRRSKPAPGNRAGFTLLEVAIALAILGGVLLVLATTTGRFIHSVAVDRVRTQANAVADAHVARMRLWPTYDSLSVEFSGTVTNFPFTGWSRQTTVTRVGGPSLPDDYTRITVAVTAPTLDSTVQRTITIASER